VLLLAGGAKTAMRQYSFMQMGYIILACCESFGWGRIRLWFAPGTSLQLVL
jgi:hypothetical protein